MREAIFQLCWTQHGGSGLGWSRQEVLDLDAGELRFWLERVEQQRSNEAKAIERAHKRS